LEIILLVFKYLISAVLISSSLPDEGVGGWFSVPKSPKTEDRAEEDDSSIWVLFVKNLGGEQLLVRFPEAPTYRYTETGDLEINSEKDGQFFQVRVQSVASGTPPVKELHYESEGKWIHEHFIVTPHHFFSLKSTSLTASAEIHREFISSFSIERNG